MADSDRSSISAHRCLTAWNEPIVRPNCSRTLAWSTAVVSAHRATPAASAAASVTATSRTRATPGDSTATGGTESSDAEPVDRERSIGAAASTVTPDAAASRTNHCSESPTAAPTSRCDVAPALQRTGTSPLTSPDPPTTSGARAGASATVTEPSAIPRTTSATAPDAAVSDAAVSDAACGARTVAATAVDSNGPGTIPAAHASSAHARSTSVPPAPPSASGTAIATTPSCASARHVSAKASGPAPSAPFTTSVVPRSRAQSRRESASACWSSVRPRATVSPRDDSRTCFNCAMARLPA